MRRLTTLVILTVTMNGCSPAPPREHVRVGTDVDAGSLDPRLMRDTTAYRVVDLLYDGLVRLDASLTPTPALAHRWEHPDDATWIFHLRDDARFHDGTPVCPVAFSSSPISPETSCSQEITRTWWARR